MARFAGRDVDRLRAEPQHHGTAVRRLVREVEANRRPARRSARPVGFMCICTTRSVPGLERPRKCRRREATLPGAQPRKWPSGKRAPGTSMPPNPGAGSRPSRRRTSWVSSIRMRAWWTTFAFPGRNSIALIHWLRLSGTGSTKLRKTSLPVPLELVRLRHRHDEVRFAELPSGRERWHDREPRRIALERHRRPPTAGGYGFRLGQPPFVVELADARLGLPRRHEPVLDRLGDQPGPLPRIVVGQEVERRRLARPMAGGTVREQDRRDVLAERHPAGRGHGSVLGRRRRRERQKAAQNADRLQEQRRGYPAAESETPHAGTPGIVINAAK